MRLFAEDPRAADLLARLAPYARSSVERAAHYARRLHADELTPEHLLVSFLEDEECAATRLVLHAFADPETIGIEVLALCPGIMVVGSERSLPFSVLGVAALEGARRLAAERGDAHVGVAHVFAAAAARLPAEAAERLGAARDPAVALEALARPSEGPPVPEEGPLFARFTQEARRTLAAACRRAARLGRAEISPAHLVLGCLEVDPELARVSGLTAPRVLAALEGRDADATPIPERRLAPDERLLDLLEALPAQAGTLEILGWMVRHGGDELRHLLRRQRITPALLEHAQEGFEDPSHRAVD